MKTDNWAKTKVFDDGFIIVSNGSMMGIEVVVKKWGEKATGDNSDREVTIKLTGSQVGDRGESIVTWRGNIEADDFKETVIPALTLLSKLL